MTTPVWLITGASNGLGLALCHRALKANHRVIGAMRDPARAREAAESITNAGGKVVQLDMNDSQTTIWEKLRAAEAIYGRVDILVNNAAYSVLGPVSEFSDREATAQFQTNFFGALYATQAVLPGMRARATGTIVNVSSMAGQDGMVGCGLYAASKFALEGLSESLAREVAVFGIGVLIVEPGAFRTNFLAAFHPNDRGVPRDDADTPAAAALRHFRGQDGRQRGDPQKAVDRIFEVVAGEGPAGHLRGKILRLPLGPDSLDRIGAKIERLKSDIDAAREVAASTDLDGQ
ncbi:NAD(P)-binding protein [Durotheca rogersii]|uniref:NAD(P)-binding protein n=1 Tax=Durotheca rogersii TaxID=419775 RepID=UPI00221F4D84|nr:NAD(P)-binding protein [Durotheca rogersii]KAI5860983.1 NAD(P)-binding protein [Durotheca rogersii]